MFAIESPSGQHIMKCGGSTYYNVLTFAGVTNGSNLANMRGARDGVTNSYPVLLQH